jgi:hypothetical protein
MNRAQPPDELDERDLKVARSLRSLPDLAPPPDLLASVMGSLEPKKLRPWQRILLWARSPRRITVTPLRLVPATTALVVLLVFGLVWVSGHVGQRAVPIHETKFLAVAFDLRFSGARSVAVIGTFNEWKPQGYELKWDQDRQVWTVTLWLPQGRYEYAFLIDGTKVISDPGALFSQEDGFGSQNSVLILRGQNGQNV